MPNLNAPSGLTPVMYRNGNKWNGQGRVYSIIATDTNPYYVGDLVKIDSANFSDANGINYVTRATADAAARGVIFAIGIAPQGSLWQGGPWINPNNLAQAFRPTGAQAVNYYCLVADDPDIVYEIQEDATAAAGVAAQSTKNANIAFNAIPTGVFVSQMTLLATSYNVAVTRNLKVLGAVQRIDNTPYTAFQRWNVMLNNNDYSAGTLGY